MLIGQLFLSNFSGSNGTSIIHSNLSIFTVISVYQNSVFLPFCAFVHVCMCVCMLV